MESVFSIPDLELDRPTTLKETEPNKPEPGVPEIVNSKIPELIDENSPPTENDKLKLRQIADMFKGLGNMDVNADEFSMDSKSSIRSHNL